MLTLMHLYYVAYLYRPVIYRGPSKKYPKRKNFGYKRDQIVRAKDPKDACFE